MVYEAYEIKYLSILEILMFQVPAFTPAAFFYSSLYATSVRKMVGD